MIQEYQIERKPITFTGKTEDLIDVNEKKKTLTFVALHVVNAKDTVETIADDERMQPNKLINTTYETAIKIDVEYENAEVILSNGQRLSLIDYVSQKISQSQEFELNFEGIVLSETSSRITVNEVKAAEPL